MKPTKQDDPVFDPWGPLFERTLAGMHDSLERELHDIIMDHPERAKFIEGIERKFVKYAAMRLL